MRVDIWHDMGNTSNLNLSWDKIGIRENRAHFPSLIERERERGEARKRRAKGFLPISTKFCWSFFFEPRTKVHRIDKGYAWVLGKTDFLEDPRKEILGD